MFDDPIVAEVRRARDELARKFNYDVRAICADLMSRQGPTVTAEELRQIKASPSAYPASSAEPSQVREKGE